jgi:hypothetical protein
MNSLMTMPQDFQYGEMPEDPMQMMQSLMMQGQGPLPATGQSQYQDQRPQATQSPADIFSGLMGGRPEPKQEIPYASNVPYGMASEGFDANALEAELARLAEEEAKAAARQRDQQYVASGAGMQHVQAPQAQAMPLQSLMQMATQRG